jgi:hypothetical protein
MNKKTIYKQLASLVLGACIMSALTACSEEKVNSDGGQKAEPIEELGVEGKYEVKFSSLNTSVAGMTVAKGTIHVIADQISVGLEVQDSPAATTHSQFIYTASECPTELNDSNNDGFIDPVEAAKVLGSILIPLDSDLNTQEDGATNFPAANGVGSYSYYQEAVLSRLVADLQSPDLNPSVEFIKLNGSEDLKLEGKVIILQGVPQDSYLPGSIRVIQPDTDRAALPIACGKIVRTNQTEIEVNESDARL